MRRRGQMSEVTMLAVTKSDGELMIQTNGEFRKTTRIVLEWDVEGTNGEMRRVIMERKIKPSSSSSSSPYTPFGNPRNDRTGLFSANPPTSGAFTFGAPSSTSLDG